MKFDSVVLRINEVDRVARPVILGHSEPGFGIDHPLNRSIHILIERAADSTEIIRYCLNLNVIIREKRTMRGLLPRDVNAGRETARVEAFSDGVFAIAITLLILEIQVPHAEAGRTLPDQLVDLWPSYFGFVLSFVVIGIMWANHHEIFGFIARVDRNLILINLLFLLCIGFLPFPTALLAEYLTHSGEQTAVVVYSASMLACALTFNLVWLYPRRMNLLDPRADQAAVQNIVRSFRIGPPLYLFAFLMAFIWPWGSLVLQAILALAYTIPPSWLNRAAR